MKSELFKVGPVRVRDPFSVFSELEALFNKPAAASWVGFPVDRKCEEDGSCVFRVNTPGLGKEDVKLDLNSDKTALILSGEKKQVHEESDYIERSFERFERYLSLPYHADTANISAKFEDDVLVITVPVISDKKTEQSSSIEIS